MTQLHATSEGEIAAPEQRSAASRLRVRRSDIAGLQAFAAGLGLMRQTAPTPAEEPAAGEVEEISLAEHFNLLRRLTAAAGDETFHLSTRPLAPGTTDFVVDTLSGAIDLEDAMKQTARAYNLMHGGYYNHVERRRGRIVYLIDDRDFPYALDPASDLAYAIMEGVLIFLHAMLSLAVGDTLTARLRCVRTRRPCRTAPDGFLAFWESPVRRRASVYALEYDADAARLPVRMRRSEPANAAAVYDLIDAMIAQRDATVPKSDIRGRVIEALASGVDNQSAVARRLGVSVATLRRRLAASGDSFRDLRRDILNQTALRMLDQGRPATDVAEALGFGDIRSFSRAFKAWNGTTPTAYARRRRG